MYPVNDIMDMLFVSLKLNQALIKYSIEPYFKMRQEKWIINKTNILHFTQLENGSLDLQCFGFILKIPTEFLLLASFAKLTIEAPFTQMSAKSQQLNAVAFSYCNQNHVKSRYSTV